MKTLTCFCLFVTIIHQAIGQTETFDIATYAPPKDWKKNAKPGVVVYSQANAGTGGFCILAIYASTQSSGDPQKDFKAKWKEQVTTAYQTEADPKTEMNALPGGWNAVGGMATARQDSIGSYVMLTVFSGFGKTMSVLANFNDPVYTTNIDEMMGNIKLNKTVLPSFPVTANNNQVTEPANADTEKFGHLLFTPIPGWSMARFANAVSFKPSDLPANRYLETRIMESKTFSGDLPQAFAESWKDALDQLQLVSPFTKPYEIITQKTSFKGWSYIQGHGTLKSIDDKNESGYTKYYVNLFVIQLNNRLERIVTFGLKNIHGSDYSPYNNQPYGNAIMDLCFGVRFDDWKESAAGILKSNPLSGLYGGLKLAGGSLNASYAMFFPNGQVFFGEKFPPDGFEGKNTWIYAEQNTRNWGVYTLANGKGNISMGYGNMPFKVSGSNLVITTQNTEHIYQKFPSLDGAVLNGKYAFNDIPGAITFTREGKFIDEGVLNILNHQTTDPPEFNITTRPGTGSYEIKNYTLVFHYSDGRKVQMVFTGNGFDRNNPSPSSLTLSFNNDILYKK